MSKSKITVVIDPEADFGKTKHRWPFFKDELLKKTGPVTTHFISRAEPAKPLYKKILSAAPEKLIIFGDDSTIHHAVNELLAAKGTKIPALGVFCSSPHSQGLFHSILPNTLRMTDQERLAACIRLAVSGNAKNIDLGLVSFMDARGKRESKYFINAASYGISERIVEQLPDMENALHSGLAFVSASLRALVKYNAPAITIKSEKKVLWKAERIFNLFIANGAYGAAGMRIAPKAKLDDGQLHLLAIPDAPVSELMMEIPKLWLDKKEMKSAVRATVPRLQVDAHSLPGMKNKVRLELDGVLTGFLPAKFEIARKVIRLLS